MLTDAQLVAEIVAMRRALRSCGRRPMPVSLDTGVCLYCGWMFAFPTHAFPQAVAEACDPANHPDGCAWRMGRTLPPEEPTPNGR